MHVVKLETLEMLGNNTLNVVKLETLEMLGNNTLKFNNTMNAFIWMYVLILSHTRFKVSPLSIVASLAIASLVEWLSVLLQTKCSWARVPLQSNAFVIIRNIILHQFLFYLKICE